MHLTNCLLCALWLLLAIPYAQAACNITSNDGTAATPAFDALSILLTSHENCPRNVFALHDTFKKAQLHVATSVVANRGFHNPTDGSFSLFETVVGQLGALTIKPGDFFLGHFTEVNAQGYLVPAQKPKKGALMIEAFAWDPYKNVFNFYELRGDGQQGQWFYKGDSTDIAEDNVWLHRQPDPEHPVFGSHLRCSGCHSSGGPIMKELYGPYNDWWQPNRPLNFGRPLTPSLQKMLTTVVPAETLADHVLLGLQKLPLLASRSLPEQLRPLFCPVEVNFMSDLRPNEFQEAKIIIPSGFFVDPRLLPPHATLALTISRAAYEAALISADSHFPETAFNDADHAWLTPVKAASDQMAVEKLLHAKIIDTKFMANVLAIDMTNPVFSPTRCHLLQFVPNSISSDWQTIFIKNLNTSGDPDAKVLAKNMSDPSKTLAFYNKQAQKFLQHCQTKLSTDINVYNFYRLLAQRRVEIAASEISKNPRGQILEPDFRVIFPTNNLFSQPQELQLSWTCEVITHLHSP